MRGSTYNYNNMNYPYNYPYGTSPMFDYAGVFTTPQVLYDTYVHWTINPFTMPTYGLYEGYFAGYDANNNQTSFKKLYVDSATNNNVNYINTFTTANKINKGYTFNLNLGSADSAFIQYFAYNTSNKLVQDSVYERHLGVWRLSAKTSYTYDGSGNLVTIDNYSNQTDTSFLLPLTEQLKYVNTYDASNRLITVLTSITNGTIMLDYVKDTFAYTGTMTFHTSWKQHQFDPIHGTWWPQYYMSKHITAGKPDTVYHKGWDSIAHAWTPISKDIVHYNATYNNPDTMQNYEYNWTSYSTSPDYTTVYYYDTFTYVPPVGQAIVAQQEDGIKIYPNPASNNVTVAIPDAWQDQQLTLSTFNANGQTVSRQSLHSQPMMEIPVSYLAPGIYWMIVQDKNGAVLHRHQLIRQ